MKPVKATLISILAVIGVALIAVPAGAQQPTAASTPVAPNPNWCPGVSESPTPPGFLEKDWATKWQLCSNLPSPATEWTCRNACRGAVEMWWRSRQPGYGQNQAPQYPAPTDKQQGPFRLKGGGWKFIAPLASPVQTPSVAPTPTSPEAPTSPQSSADPPGPFSLFSGAGISATSAASQPPDVAADVSSTQNVEFINGFEPNPMGLTNTTGGLYVYDKTGVQKRFYETVSFWCGSNGVNGQLLTGCVPGTPPTETLTLVDTQVAFVPALGLWIATQMAQSNNPTQANPDQVYLAVSNTSDATGTWTKWSLPVCNTDATNNVADQPLLGWSSTLVAIDATCGTANASGPDNLILIPNSMITSHAVTLPKSSAAPCDNMTPARDETSSFTNLYLVASIVPPEGGGPTGNLSTCAPSFPNTEPYIIEYTATTNGTTVTVSGSSGACVSGSSCAPVSTSFQDGMPGNYILNGPASQKVIDPPYGTVCATAPEACDIDLGNARITTAQIRSSSNGSGTNLPILTAAFSTGIQASGPGIPFSQALAFLQDLSSGNWLGNVQVSDGVNGWVAYPTIALDNDGDFYYAFTTFGPNILPTSTWAGVTGFLSSSPQGEGSGTLESSGSTYTGQAGTTLLHKDGPQRWGDYNTMVYDPSETGPGGEASFWQIEETSKGGTDQSSTWFALADPTPLPFFVNSNNQEDELCEGGGNDCTITVNAPSGTQLGDLVLVALLLGEPASGPGNKLLPDSSWTLLSASNISGTPQQLSASDSNSGGTTITTWVAAHIFGFGDSGSYDFTHFVNAVGPEFGAFTVVYRGANVNLSGLQGYGFKRGGNNNSFTTGAVIPPAESQLVSMAFGDIGCEGENKEPNGTTFLVPTGVPALTPETTLTPAPFPWLLSDVGVPLSDQSYGGYTFKAKIVGSSCSITTGAWIGWEVAIPEL